MSGTLFSSAGQPSVGAFGWQSGDKRAILYLFSGQEIPDVAIRPSQFEFTANFCERVAETIEQGNQDYQYTVGGNRSGRTNFWADDMTNSVIRPAQRAISVDTRHFQDLYTFMLILDNDDVRGANRRRPTNTRLVYIGYVLDDNIVSRQFGRTAYNERALLMPTHMTKLSVNTIANATGNIIKPMILADVDVINPNTITQLNPKRVYSLEPDRLVKSYLNVGDGTIVDTPSFTQINEHSRDNLQMDTSVKSPKQQLKMLLNGLQKSWIHNTSGIRNAYGSDSYNRDFDSERMIIANSMKSRLPDEFLGIALNEAISLGRLFKEYPSLRHNTEVIDLPFHLDVDALDVRNPTITNIWTAMVQSVLPSWLSYFGICDLSFRYCSCNPRASIVLDDEPIYEIYDIGTSVDQPQNSIKATWELCLERLETDLFSLIVEHCGDFDLTVKYSANNYFVVQLQLLNEEPIDGYAVTHSTIAPLTTSLIGTETHRDHNANQMDTMINVVSTMSYGMNSDLHI